jgi:hypothetical protein
MTMGMGMGMGMGTGIASRLVGSSGFDGATSLTH